MEARLAGLHESSNEMPGRSDMQITGNTPKPQLQLQQIQERGGTAGIQKAAGLAADGNGHPAAVKDTFVNAYPVMTRPQAQTAGECVPLPRPGPDIYPSVLPRRGSQEPRPGILPSVLPRPGAGQPLDPGACVMPRPVSPQMQNKLDEWAAQRKLDETVHNANGDGRVTGKEQRHIDSAGRDLEIAKARVALDQAKEAHSAIREQAVRDGTITREEGEAQLQAWSRVESLQRKLAGPEITDKVMDSMDQLQEQVDKLQPRPERWGWCKSDEFTFPKFPDFPRPPCLRFEPALSIPDYGRGAIG
jgi:hypothetical protein